MVFTSSSRPKGFWRCVQGVCGVASVCGLQFYPCSPVPQQMERCSSKTRQEARLQPYRLTLRCRVIPVLASGHCEYPDDVHSPQRRKPLCPCSGCSHQRVRATRRGAWLPGQVHRAPNQRCGAQGEPRPQSPARLRCTSIHPASLCTAASCSQLSRRVSQVFFGPFAKKFPDAQARVSPPSNAHSCRDRAAIALPLQPSRRELFSGKNNLESPLLRPHLVAARSHRGVVPDL